MDDKSRVRSFSSVIIADYTQTHKIHTVEAFLIAVDAKAIGCSTGSRVVGGCQGELVSSLSRRAAAVSVSSIIAVIREADVRQ